jgi:hypothetical protein
MCLAVQSSSHGTEDSDDSETDIGTDMGPGIETDSEESETDEDLSDDALEYVRVLYIVMLREVEGQVDSVVVILSVVRPPASLMGLIYNLALM